MSEKLMSCYKYHKLQVAILFIVIFIRINICSNEFSQEKLLNTIII